MDRLAVTKTVTIAESEAESAAFDMSALVMGVVRMPAEWTAAGVGFKVSDGEGGTFLPLYDEETSIVQIGTSSVHPVAGRAYGTPPELSGAHWVKLWSQDGSGSDTNQAAARTLEIDLKA